MDQTLTLWRVAYGISDEAYNQLCMILWTFGQAGEIAFANGSYAGSHLTEDVFNTNPLEIGLPANGFLNGSTSNWHGDPSHRLASRSDFLDPSRSNELHESPQDGDSHTSSNEPLTGSAGTVQSDIIITTPLAQDPLMWLVLKLCAANRLLMKGWENGGLDTLGMGRVTDENPCLFNTVPAPRVVQNQLDRNLELYLAGAEIKFLKALQNAMLQTRAQKWIVIFIPVGITLHMRERDIWRLEHWVLDPDVVSPLPCRTKLPINEVLSPTNGDILKRMLL